MRIESTEKLDAPRSRAKYGSPPAARQSRIAVAAPHRATASTAAAILHTEAESSEPVVAETVDRILTRARGDEKYWAQICHAHELLSHCVGTELAMTEAMSRGESVLEPIFRDALEAQEMDRLNAVTMLAVLRELVTHSDGERLAAASARAASAALPSSSVTEAVAQHAGKRARSEEDQDGESDERYSPDSLQGDSEAVASLSLAVPPASPPLLTPPQTPPLVAAVAGALRAKKLKAISPAPGSPPLFAGGVITPPRSPPPVAASLPASLRASPAASVSSSASTQWTPQVTPERPHRMSLGGLAPDHPDSITPEPPQRPGGLAAAALGACSDEKDAVYSKRKKVRSYDAPVPLSAFPEDSTQAGKVPWALAAAPSRNAGGGSGEFRP